MVEDEFVEKALASWTGWLNEYSPIVDLLKGVGCTTGEALMIIQLNTMMHAGEESFEQLKELGEDGDDWKHPN